MNDHPVLGQVALGHSPMIDRHRAITALRLTVFARAVLRALAAARQLD